MNGEWVQLQLPNPAVVNSFTIVSRTAGAANCTFTIDLLGSTDQTAWYTIAVSVSNDKKKKKKKNLQNSGTVHGPTGGPRASGPRLRCRHTGSCSCFSI